MLFFFLICIEKKVGKNYRWRRSTEVIKTKNTLASRKHHFANLTHRIEWSIFLPHSIRKILTIPFSTIQTHTKCKENFQYNNNKEYYHLIPLIVWGDNSSQLGSSINTFFPVISFFRVWTIMFILLVLSLIVPASHRMKRLFLPY